MKLYLILAVQNSSTVSTFEICIFFSTLSKFLSVRIDRLAGAGAHMLSDFSPVTPIKPDRIQKALVLTISPVSIAFSPFVVH